MTGSRYLLILILISVFISGCTHAVVPQSGPTMQQVYDGMNSGNIHGTQAITPKNNIQPNIQSSSTAQPLNKNDLQQGFVQVNNPNLNLTVFPHLVADESDTVVIPEYQTIFSAYQKTHYVWRVY